MSEHQVADRVFGQQAPQADGQWLVVIVLADEDGTPCLIAPRDDRKEVLGLKKCRLLDQHVLACGKRLLRQIEMESRRDRDDDGVDAAIRDRLVIAAKRCPAAELAAEFFRLPAIAACVARNDGSRQRRLQVPAMYPRDESAPEERDLQRLRHAAAQAFFLAVPPIWKPDSLKSNHAARSGPFGVSVNTILTGPENAVSGPE